MPAPYAKIACFIDQDPASGTTLAEAVALRALSAGELHLVHVAPTPWALYADVYAVGYQIEEIAQAARQWLEEQAAMTPGATPVLLEGWAPAAACDYVAREEIDLVVAAAHRGRMSRAILGGFASYLAYHASCPVLLVHPAPAGEGG
jgi:nucleotide-binding universal stress UspA family protein